MAVVTKRVWSTNKGDRRSAFQVDFVHANGERARQQFKTRREANDFRIAIEGQLRDGSFRPDASRVTVGEAAQEFLKHCEERMQRQERMTRKTFKVYEGHVLNYICPDPSQTKIVSRRSEFTGGLTALKLNQLTSRRVNDFRDALRHAGVSVPTTRKILSTLQLILAHAISRDLIAVNVAAGVKVIGRRDEGSRKITPPSKTLVRKLIEIASLDFSVKVQFAASTGVRAGELHALRWRQLDLTSGIVTIETRVDAYGNEDVTKTEAGMRDIPLSAALIKALLAWKSRTAFKKPNDLVFPNRSGSYCSHDNMVKRHYQPLFDKLSARFEEMPSEFDQRPRRFNWHALRHFAISCWIEAGLKPKTVQTFAGHSSLQVTMDRYGHLFKSDDHREAMNLIAKDVFG